MRKTFVSKILRALAAAVTLALFPACQDLLHLEPMEPADISVPELVKRMSQATDPKHRYHDCKSYLMRQTLSVMQSGTKETMAIEIHFQAPDKMRIITYKDKQPTVVEIYNAGKGWRYDCATRTTVAVPSGHPIELMRIFTQMGTPSLDPTQIFKEVSIDMQIEDGYKTYRLICDPGVKGIAPYVFYVNGKTFLTERMETIMYINGEEYLYVNVPADYSWYADNSIRLPVTSTVKLMDSTRISKMTDFKIDVDFPASDFLPPVPFSHRIPPKAESAKKPAAKAEPVNNSAKEAAKP
ncbi:MAG: hypothetical protein IJS14_11610 [Lentisphaeria bacterium]|nr:hypothetical protein [Lentisphaeria bacterium]